MVRVRSPRATSSIGPTRSMGLSGVDPGRPAAPLGEADGVVGPHPEAVRRPVLRPVTSQEVPRQRWVCPRWPAPRSSRSARRWPPGHASRGRPCVAGSPSGHRRPRRVGHVEDVERDPALDLAVRAGAAGDVAHHDLELGAPVACGARADRHRRPGRADLHRQVGELGGLDHGRLGVADAGGQVAGQVEGLRLAGLSVDTRIGASEGGGVRTTRIWIRPGSLSSAATAQGPGAAGLWRPRRP